MVSNYNRLNGLLDIVLLLTLGFPLQPEFRALEMVLCDLFCSTIAHNGEWFRGEPGDRQASLLSRQLVRLCPTRWPWHHSHCGRLLRLHPGWRSGGRRKNRRRPYLSPGWECWPCSPCRSWVRGRSLTGPHLYPLTQFRELVTLGTILVMAFLVFAKQHGMRIELATANRVLQEASATDPLTGARNRRFFDTTIAGDASQVLRSYQTQESRFNDLIFYMVDLDDFKEVNDTYGHSVGDKVLLEVTRRINSVIRSSDFLVRWGGDEFLIVSRFSNRAEAAAFASRIMAVVGNRETDAGQRRCHLAPDVLDRLGGFPVGSRRTRCRSLGDGPRIGRPRTL